jgi:hypothetical protein
VAVEGEQPVGALELERDGDGRSLGRREPRGEAAADEWFPIGRDDGEAAALRGDARSVLDEGAVVARLAADEAAEGGGRELAAGAQGELAAAEGELEAVEIATGDLAPLQSVAELGERGEGRARGAAEVGARGDPCVAERGARGDEREQEEEESLQASGLRGGW